MCLKSSWSVVFITTTFILLVLIMLPPVLGDGLTSSSPVTYFSGTLSAVSPAPYGGTSPITSEIYQETTHIAGYPAIGSIAAASETPVLTPRPRGNAGENDAGLLPGTSTGAASRNLLARARSLFSPLVASLVLFAALAALSAILVLFLRQKYPALTFHPQQGVTSHRTLLTAGAWIILGSLLAVLTILVLASLTTMNGGTIAIAGGKVLCALCIFLSVSSFFLAYSILYSESVPAITGIHGALAALAIIGFAYLMISAPERRGIVLFLLIVLLAASAALAVWQNRRQLLPQASQGATSDAKAPTVHPGSPVTVIDTSTRSRDSTHSTSGPVSHFPAELKGKYYDISCIGSGGFAMVFTANRISDGKKVAIKIPVSYTESTGKSFLNEIRVWETLHHPNIVEVLAVNILPVPYVEMEYVPASLDSLRKPVPVAQALDIIRQIAGGLIYAHGFGIIHRDIKPHNILITPDMTPKITDWGMSKDLSVGEDKKTTLAGYSLDYASPEQISPSGFGITDPRTDIYQLGVVFYELVTGSLPFCGDSFVDTVDAILHKEPVPPSVHNPEAAPVDAIILKCLEKEPSKRFPSVSRFIDALSVADTEKPPMKD